ncbi:MAG TPA: hypothetical protein VHB79_09685 [Polyangiaceae bacterium]|nr:hypothetical protein [Polyangiaceae bacterium]
MQRKIDQFATALCAMLVVGALLACKKRVPVGAIPSAASAAAEPTPTPPAPPTAATAASAAAAEGAAKLGDVKRYADKEKAQTGAARILQDDVKVFNEADEKTADVATLDKGLLVFRLASIPDWELVEFPSGVGKVSPGWVQAKFVDTKSDATVAREAVAAQAAVKTPAPKTSASAVASAKPAASTSASAKASASAAASTKPATSVASPIAVDSASLARAAKLAQQMAAQAKAAADKAAAGVGGKSGK